MQENLTEEHNKENIEEPVTGADCPDSNDLFVQILNKMNGIQKSFDEKIRTDEHKNAMFDNMHKELTDFRNGAYESGLTSMYMDIISLIDTYSDVFRHFSECEQDEKTYKQLLSNFSGIVYDLQDVLYRQGVEAFSSDGAEEGIVNPKTQKIVRFVPTDNKDMHNRPAENISPGYEKNGKIIRPEKIAIYKFQKGEQYE